jgi:hypothetical protein
MATPKDLVVLTADSDAKAALEALLARPADLGIRPIKFEVKKHNNRDNGCRTDAHNLLRPLVRDFRYCIVIFDYEGSGGEKQKSHEIETDVFTNMERNGWGERAAVIVLRPELEIWLWSESKQVGRVLGWAGRQPDLRTWLAEQGWLDQGAIKPQRPKEAFDAAIRAVGEPRSAALFGQLAQKVPVSTCVDPAFEKLKTTLQTWFPL